MSDHEEKRLHLSGASLVSLSEGKPNKTYGQGRVCAKRDCSTVLSIYNAEEWCWEHTPREFTPDPTLSRARKEVHAGTYNPLEYVRHGSYWARVKLGCPCKVCDEASARAVARARGINKKREATS